MWRSEGRVSLISFSVIPCENQHHETLDSAVSHSFQTMQPQMEIRPWLLAVLALGALVFPAVSEEAAKDGSLEDKGKYLFGSFSTATFTVVQASTSTVFLSCIQASAPDLCKGRKRASRKLQGAAAQPFMEKKSDSPASQTSLEPSNGEPLATLETGSKDAKDGKLGFTIWTTSKTTTSITVFYTNTSTTIRLSYGCVAGLMTKPSSTCNG